MPIIDPGGQKPSVERMHAVYAPGQQIERQPAPFIFIIGLISEMRRGKDTADILGLHEASRRDIFADRLHSQGDCTALRDCQLQTGSFVGAERIPETVQTTDTRGGEGLIDGCV